VTRFFLVCLGGAAGSGARYLVAIGLGRWLGAGFPWGTLAVNLSGSFLIGVVLELGFSYGAMAPDLRLFLATGVLGGFTTYSSFNYEVLGYLQRGAWAIGGLYLGVTLGGCLVAGLLGLVAARLLGG
jgi:CrcB protein